MKPFKILCKLFALVAGAMIAGTASATNPLIYVGPGGTGTGSTCAVITTPCGNFPDALSAVDAGGVIVILDTGVYNSAQVSITKSVTIEGAPGAVGIINVPTTMGADSGILISTTGGAVKVTLRNLLLKGTGVSNGIRIDSGDELNVESCEFVGIGNAGIYVNAAVPVSVTNSLFRSNTYGIQIPAAATVSINKIQAVSNTSGVFAQLGSKTAIANSLFVSNATSGITAVLSASGTTQLAVERSMFQKNQYGVVASSTNSGANAAATVSRSTFTNNDNAVACYQASSSTCKIVVTANTVTNNTIGFLLSGTSFIYTLEDNTVLNTTDVSGGSLDTGTVNPM